MKKLLPKRKPERKPSDEEFALRKSESVCTEARVCLTPHSTACLGEGDGFSKTANTSWGISKGNDWSSKSDKLLQERFTGDVLLDWTRGLWRE